MMTRTGVTRCGAITILLTGLAGCETVGSRQSNVRTPTSTVRIGTFDSRALAMAYYRSDDFHRLLGEQRKEYNQAKEAGDSKRVEELEAEGPALQELIHKQGFGTCPVDNILKKIKGELPDIARQANVAFIVSKWDVVYQRPRFKLVDVTDLMVAPFDPDEKTRKVIQDIQKQTPVPSEDLEKHQH